MIKKVIIILGIAVFVVAAGFYFFTRVNDGAVEEEGVQEPGGL